MSDQVGNPEDRFSQNKAHIKWSVSGSKLHGHVSMMESELHRLLS